MQPNGFASYLIALKRKQGAFLQRVLSPARALNFNLQAFEALKAAYSQILLLQRPASDPADPATSGRAADNTESVQLKSTVSRLVIVVTESVYMRTEINFVLHFHVANPFLGLHHILSLQGWRDEIHLLPDGTWYQLPL